MTIRKNGNSFVWTILLLLQVVTCPISCFTVPRIRLSTITTTTSSSHRIYNPSYSSNTVTSLYHQSTNPLLKYDNIRISSRISNQQFKQRQSTTMRLYNGSQQQAAIVVLLKETCQILFPTTTGQQVPLVYALVLNIILFTIGRSKLLSALTLSGYIHAMILGTGLWTFLGWKGWTTCVLYLVLGQIVTKIKFIEKTNNGLAEGRGGRRGPENVWGSAATGLVCAACAAQRVSIFGMSSSNIFLLGYVTSLATKLADTFASEIGKAYGKTTFLITSLERVAPGTEGAISLEGTVAALLGGFLLSFYGLSIGLINGYSSLAIATLSAFIATNIESLLGATIQGKPGLEWITNEMINFANTFIGASIAMIFAKLFLKTI